MSMFNRFRNFTIGHRKTDEGLYSIVAQEMEDGIRHKGLWIKALEQSQGDTERQIAEYIKLRVQSLKDDIAIQSEVNKKTAAIGQSYDVEDLVKMIKNNSSIDVIDRSFSQINKNDLIRLVNTPDAIGEYPLHVCIKENRSDVCEWLLQIGADINVRNDWGRTPLNLATRKKYENLANLLREHLD